MLKKTLPIKLIGESVLEKKALPVAKITPELLQLADTMLVTMRKAEGCGLAAPQVGISSRIFVIELEPPEDDNGNPLPLCSPGERLLYPLMPIAVFNPEIVEYSSETEVMEEGCLSIPKLRVPVERPVSVRLKGTLANGVQIDTEIGGFLARAVQHEYDHLDGIVYLQRAEKEDVDAQWGAIEKIIRRTGRKKYVLKMAEKVQ